MREFSRGLLLEDLEIVSFLFIMTNFVYSIKIYKFTVRNKYHCGHHAMRISVRTTPYNFVMLYVK